MKSVFLWGAGKNFRIVKQYLQDDVLVKGVFDVNPDLQGTVIDGIRVIRPNRGIVDENDVVIITVSKYDSIYSEADKILGIDIKRIVPFWKLDYDMNPYAKYIDLVRWKNSFYDELRKKYQNDINIYKNRLVNQKYELKEELCANPPQLPIIRDGIEALRLVAEDGKSMCRYGDGEFEIVHGRERTKLQKPNSDLQIRLKEILINSNESVLTCIARLYGDLKFFDDFMADVCRAYLTPEVRAENMSVLDMSKTYYDAYVSRPYIFARDKIGAKDIFTAWKKIWERREIVFVEGSMTRCGYKNDLFANAASIERILCPPTDSWNYYNEIYEYILNHVSKNKLILIALGPTATVLAYDLAKKGYQAIDMGHLDNEYEWYIRGCTEMEKVPYKYMNNMGECGRIAEEVNDEEYICEIIKRIGC